MRGNDYMLIFSLTSSKVENFSVDAVVLRTGEISVDMLEVSQLLHHKKCSPRFYLGLLVGSQHRKLGYRLDRDSNVTKSS